MAGDSEDDSSKTEEPTSRRLEQSREKGDVAVSQDLKMFTALLGAAAGIALLLPAAAHDLAMSLQGWLANADAISVNASALPGLLVRFSLHPLVAILPFLGLIAIIAIGTSIGQVGLMWAPNKIAPSFGKISLQQGVKRLFSINGIVEFVKGLAKLIAVCIAATCIVRPFLHHMEHLLTMAPVAILHRVSSSTVSMVAAGAGVMAFVAALDFFYQKFSFLRRMRMTRQEVRDEHKDAEGDPHIKARIRRIRAERSRKRMMAAVPKADVVITNPTHFAVALSYKMNEMAAPRVVAKGADRVAFRIRTVAEENGVPVVENPPLARALYATVDVDQEIPAEHYQAVAQIIGYVMRLRRNQ